jgi:hypothetical protein
MIELYHPIEDWLNDWLIYVEMFDESFFLENTSHSSLPGCDGELMREEINTLPHDMVHVNTAKCFESGERFDGCTHPGCMHRENIRFQPGHNHNWVATGATARATILREGGTPVRCTHCGRVGIRDWQPRNSIIKQKAELSAIGHFTAAEVKFIYENIFCPATYAHSFNELMLAYGIGDGVLSSASTVYLWNHFRSNVLGPPKENRLNGFSPVFHADYYLATHYNTIGGYNVDQLAAFAHFVRHGIYEGRTAHPHFDVFAYSYYPDLRIAFGAPVAGGGSGTPGTLYKFTQHYVRYGFFQGRPPK